MDLRACTCANRVRGCTNSLVEDLENTLRILQLALFIVLTSLLRMIKEYFIDNQLSKDLSIQSVLLKFKIEIFNMSIRGLVFFLVKFLEEWMFEGLFGT